MIDIVGHGTPQHVASPCTNLCKLDPMTGWCIGCGRTGDEIGRWLNADDRARRAILAELPARMKALGMRQDGAAGH